MPRNKLEIQRNTENTQELTGLHYSETDEVWSLPIIITFLLSNTSFPRSGCPAKLSAWDKEPFFQTGNPEPERTA